MAKALKIIGGGVASVGGILLGAALTTPFQTARENGASYLPALGWGARAIASGIWSGLTSIWFLWPASLVLTIVATLWVVVLIRERQDADQPTNVNWSSFGVAMQRWAEEIDRISEWHLDQGDLDPNLKAFLLTLTKIGLHVPTRKNGQSNAQYVAKLIPWLANTGALLRQDHVAEAKASF